MVVATAIFALFGCRWYFRPKIHRPMWHFLSFLSSTCALSIYFPPANQIHSTKFMQKAKSCSTQYFENQISKNRNQLCRIMCRIKNNIEQCTIVVLYSVLCCVVVYMTHYISTNTHALSVRWNPNSISFIHSFTYQMKMLMIFLSDVVSFIHSFMYSFGLLSSLHIVFRFPMICLVNWCNSIAWSHICTLHGLCTLCFGISLDCGSKKESLRYDEEFF